MHRIETIRLSRVFIRVHHISRRASRIPDVPGALLTLYEGARKALSHCYRFPPRPLTRCGPDYPQAGPFVRHPPLRGPREFFDYSFLRKPRPARFQCLARRSLVIIYVDMHDLMTEGRPARIARNSAKRNRRALWKGVPYPWCGRNSEGASCE